MSDKAEICALCHQNKAQHMFALPGLSKPVAVCDDCKAKVMEEQ